MGQITDYSLISLDTNIFVYYFDSNSTFFPEVKDIFTQIDVAKVKILLPVMVFAEILSHPPLTENQITEYSSFFEENDLFLFKNVDTKVAKTAAFLRRKYKIKILDAIILASAIESGADVFITADSKLQKVEEIEVFVLGNNHP